MIRGGLGLRLGKSKAPWLAHSILLEDGREERNPRTLSVKGAGVGSGYRKKEVMRES